jgi:hypothetical protein
MAIWQYNLKIIPSGESITKLNINSDELNANDAGLLLSWHDYAIRDSSIVEISQYLKPHKSWSEDIKQFGALDETCMELYYDGSELEEVSIRIDLRSVGYKILNIIIDFVNINNTLMINDNGEIIGNTLEELIKDIKKSKAYSFLRDPKIFFENHHRD